MNQQQTALSSQSTSQQSEPPKFSFTICKPFTSIKSSTRYLVDGMIRQGGLCALAGKPKLGKSSLGRYLAVQVAKGLPFLGRDTERGESLLISCEDPTEHIDSALRALDYDPDVDESIHLVDAISRKLDENVAAIREAIQLYPGIKLIVIDTLPKLVKVRDQNSYDEWLPVLDEFRQILRDYPEVSIIALLHFKKSTGDDIFDSMLGSSALRGEFDSNLGLYKNGNTRLFTTESRIGRAIEPTLLIGQLIEIDGSNLVSNFSLGQSLDSVEEEKRIIKETKRIQSMDERVVAHLTGCDDDSSLYKTVLEEVKGQTASKIAAINRLLEQRVVTASGVKGSPTDPYKLVLDRTALPTFDFLVRFDGKVN